MNSIHKREKQTLGIVVSLFLLLLLVFHFTLTLIYNFRNIEKETPLTQFATAYTEPLFTQNFKIFAPNVPTINYKLFVRYFDKQKGWTDWKNQGTALQEEHQRNRFSSAGYEYLIYKNAINELLYAREDALYYATKNKIPKKDFVKYVNNSMRNSLHFHSVKIYLQSLLRENFSTKKMECALRVEKLKDASFEPNSWQSARINYLFFPVIELR